MSKKHTILFTPGPVSVKQEVLLASTAPILFHRTEPLENMFYQITKKLTQFFGGNSHFISLLVTGSGTLVNEIVLTSFLANDDKLLIISNGHFAERLAVTAQLHNLQYRILKYDWTSEITLSEVETIIQDFKPKIVAMVALETSTGMINPVSEIGRICQRNKTIFFVDGVSAIGAENIKVARDHVDICTSVPNKALEAPPGLSFICIKEAVLNQLKDNPSSYYLDLGRYYTYYQKNQFPTTPAISLMQSLNVALDIFFAETLEGRIKRYQRLSSIVDAKAKFLGIRQLIDKRNRANAISTFYFPTADLTTKLRDQLLEEGFTVWHHDYDQPDIRLQSIMQVSVMGEISEKEISELFYHIASLLPKSPLEY